MRPLTPVQVLGACGLVAAILVMLATRQSLAAAGAIMAFANVYCLVRG